MAARKKTASKTAKKSAAKPAGRPKPAAKPAKATAKSAAKSPSPAPKPSRSAAKPAAAPSNSSATPASQTKKLSPELEALRDGLEKLVGRPLGPTLTALLQHGLRNDCFGGLLPPTKWSPELRKRRLDEQGILIIGEAGHGFFGPHISRLGATIDAGPIVYSDKQNLPPEIAGRDLAEFLSIWAFHPDFFSLYPSTSDEFDELHAQLLSGEDADPELQEDVDAVLKMPGVRKLTSGKEVRALCNQLVVVANEVWPDRKIEPIPPERTREEARVAARDALKARFGKSELTLDEVGQEFEVTRKRIRAIEAKALRKLVEHDVARGRFSGDVEARVAEMMKVSVEELRSLQEPPKP